MLCRDAVSNMRTRIAETSLRLMLLCRMECAFRVGTRQDMSMYPIAAMIPFPACTGINLVWNFAQLRHAADVGHGILKSLKTRFFVQMKKAIRLQF